MASLPYVWWYPHHYEYNFSIVRPQGWPEAPPTRPYTLPKGAHQFYTEQEDPSDDRLLYTKPVSGFPKNREVTLGGSDPCPNKRLAGFHGHGYRDEGPPGYLCNGPKRDTLYWFQRNPYQPSHEDERLLITKEMSVPRQFHSGLGRCDPRHKPCLRAGQSDRDPSDLNPCRLNNSPFTTLPQVDDTYRKPLHKKLATCWQTKAKETDPSTLSPCGLDTCAYKEGREPAKGGEPYARYQRIKLVDDFKRKTQDTVGFL